MSVDTTPVMKKLHGFTLIELLIAIAILAIMVTLAVPSYSSFIKSNRLSSAYNSLVGTISLARMEAVKSSRVVSMCISSNQTSCDGSSANDWNNGWIVFSDFDGDGIVESGDGDTILRRERAKSPGVTIKSGAYGSLISIAPRGRLRAQGTFVVCDQNSTAKSAIALNLWVTGLGRQATDGDDDDNIVEDLSGTNVNCS